MFLIQDVDRLAGDLPNLFHKYEVPDPTFNHFDFILGSDSKQLLYNELMRVMRLKEENEPVEIQYNDIHGLGSNDIHTLDNSNFLLKYIMSKYKTMF